MILSIEDLKRVSKILSDTFPVPNHTADEINEVSLN